VTVASLKEYPLRVADKIENYHGNQVLFVGWDRHLMISSPMAFPLPPDMPFATLVQDVLPIAYNQHPEWDQINWETTQWVLDGEPFTPDMSADLAENGIAHKSLLRFTTPELQGIGGSGS